MSTYFSKRRLEVRILKLVYIKIIEVKLVLHPVLAEAIMRVGCVIFGGDSYNLLLKS